MPTRESPRTVHASRDLHVGPGGWPNPVNGCLQLHRCHTSNCQRYVPSQPLWSRQVRQINGQAQHHGCTRVLKLWANNSVGVVKRKITTQHGGPSMSFW